jgi:hypothetical protein
LQDKNHHAHRILRRCMHATCHKRQSPAEQGSRAGLGGAGPPSR